MFASSSPLGSRDLTLARGPARPLPQHRCVPAASGERPSGQPSNNRRGDAQQRSSGRRPQRRPGGGGGGGALQPGGSDWCDVESAPAWRVLNVSVPAEVDPGKDDYSVHPALLAALAKKLNARGGPLPPEAVRLVRKSFDARPARAGVPAT